jgi:hypothetical protein
MKTPKNSEIKYVNWLKNTVEIHYENGEIIKKPKKQLTKTEMKKCVAFFLQ